MLNTKEGRRGKTKGTSRKQTIKYRYKFLHISNYFKILNAVNTLIKRLLECIKK